MTGRTTYEEVGIFYFSDRVRVEEFRGVQTTDTEVWVVYLYTPNYISVYTCPYVCGYTYLCMYTYTGYNGRRVEIPLLLRVRYKVNLS